MARSDDFNPKATLVVKHAKGLKMGGREYAQGDPVKDDCISLRKRHQLFRQNVLCYPHELAAIREANEKEPTEEEIAAAAADAETKRLKAEADQAAEDERKRLEAEADQAKADQEEADRLAAEKEQSDADAAAAAEAEPVVEDTQNGDESTQEGDAEAVEVSEKDVADVSEVLGKEPVVPKTARGRRRARKTADAE